MTPSSSTGSFFFTEEVLGRIMNLVLTTERQMLVENIDPRRFLTVLQQGRIIGRRESDEIKSACSRSVYEGTEKLLDTLMTKGSPGYIKFCEALLQDRTQLHLLGALNACLERFKYNYRRHVEQQESQRQYSMYNTKEWDSQKVKTMSDHHHTAKHLTPSCPPSNSVAYPPKYHNNTHHLAPHSIGALPAHRARSPMPTDEGFMHPEPHIGYPPMHENYHMYAEHGTHQDAFPQTYGNGSGVQVGYVGTVGYFPDQSFIPCSGADNSFSYNSHIDPGPQALQMPGDFQHLHTYTGIVQNHAIDVPCGQQGN